MPKENIERLLEVSTPTIIHISKPVDFEKVEYWRLMNKDNNYRTNFGDNPRYTTNKKVSGSNTLFGIQTKKRKSFNSII